VELVHGEVGVPLGFEFGVVGGEFFFESQVGLEFVGVEELFEVVFGDGLAAEAAAQVGEDLAGVGVLEEEVQD